MLRNVSDGLHRGWLAAGIVTALVGFSLGGAARADSVNVDISSLVNTNAQTALNGGSFPGGGTTLTNDGVSFLLANYPGGGTGVIQTPESNTPIAIDISVNIVDPATVYTLINSAYGESASRPARSSFWRPEALTTQLTWWKARIFAITTTTTGIIQSERALWVQTMSTPSVTAEARFDLTSRLSFCHLLSIRRR